MCFSGQSTFNDRIKGAEFEPPEADALAALQLKARWFKSLHLRRMVAKVAPS